LKPVHHERELEVQESRPGPGTPADEARNRVLEEVRQGTG
jgi:hypothetical protein